MVALVEWTEEEPDPTEASLDPERRRGARGGPGRGRDRTATESRRARSSRSTVRPLWCSSTPCWKVSIRSRASTSWTSTRASASSACLWPEPSATKVSSSPSRRPPPPSPMRTLNLAGFRQAQVIEASVTPSSLEEIALGAQGAVLDPPRSGVDKGVLEALINEPTLEQDRARLVQPGDVRPRPQGAARRWLRARFASGPRSLRDDRAPRDRRSPTSLKAWRRVPRPPAARSRPPRVRGSSSG